MVVLLHLVAIAMIAIGGAAIVFGSEIVLVERGWSMLIAGSVGASSGAVLLGIATVARILRRLQTVLAAFGTADGRAGEQPRPEAVRDPVEVPAAVAPDTSPDISLRGPIAPHDPASSATPAWTDAAFAVPQPETVEVPVQEIEPPRRSVGSRRERTGPSGETITKVRDRVFVREVSVASEPEVEPAPVLSVPPAPPSLAVPAEPPATEPPVAEPPGIADPPVAVTDQPRPAAAPEPVLAPDRKVIGQYSSGGNAYIMYADGSIEADTPSGRYLFGSLDELKAFVSVGGENEPKAARG